MENFTIHGLVQELEQVMDTVADPQPEVARRLRDTVARYGAEAIIEALEAAIPAGASIGEMIVHRSPKLTLLYGRAPSRFRSAIHDHTVFACIAQLSGAETSVVYEPAEDGEGLAVVRTVTGRPGDVTTLPADAIHHIENPTDEVASALHVYGGDFGAVMGDRSVWSHDAHERGSFSFEKLLQQSVVAMKRTGNDEGLQGLVEAIPAIKPMVDGLTSITCVRDPIQRPDEPRHFMVLKPLSHEVTATRGGLELARTRDAVRMHEAGYDLYDPVVYFPRADVNMQALRVSAKRTRCPLKGKTEYFDLVVGDRVIEDAAWSFREVVEFDPRIEVIRERIAFDRAKVQVTETTVSDDVESVGARAR